MDFWQFFRNWLLQYTQGNANSLQILSTSGDMDIDCFQSGVVDNRGLTSSQSYFDEWYSQMVSLMENFLLQTREVVHDKCLLSRINEIDGVRQCQKSNTSKGQQLAQFVCHDYCNDYILIKMQEKYTKTVSGYKFTDRLLGKGTFSEVFLAYSEQKKRVAVKVIPRVRIEEEQTSKFLREVDILSKLKHDNIVELIDFKRSQNNFYLFLQYCEGGNLAEYIQKRKRLPETEAMKIFGQILRGMSTMHHFKIVHRDLKPANIMLKNGRVKIVDFGLACKYGQNQMLRTLAGTPLNMAPQILKGKLYNQKVDIYSAGTVLYQMLYGAVPFKERDTSALIEAIEQGKMTQRNEQISQSTRNLLQQMLRSQPQERIELNDLLDFMQKYQMERKKQRLEQYRRMSLQNLILGPVGSLSQNFNFEMNGKECGLEMDMRLYNGFCRKLSVELIKA